MDDEDGHVDELGEADRSMRRLALGDAGMGDRMIARRAQPVLDEFCREPADHVVIFGMDHDQRALAPRHRHDVEHLVVVEP